MGLLSVLPPPIAGKTGWPWTEEVDPGIYDASISWPRITIVTPSYNQGAFIEETIRSILLQNYPNLEYIVMDGGSTDDSAAVIKKYSSWLTHWASEKDKGQSDAINKGIAKSTGDIFNWINSDDMLEPKACHSIATHWKKDTECLYAQSHVLMGDKKFPLYLQDYGIAEFIFSLPASQQATFVSLPKIKSVGGVEEKCHYVMDGNLYTRLALDPARTVKLKDFIAIFRNHESAKSNALGKEMHEEVLREFSRFLEENKRSDLVTVLQKIKKYREPVNAGDYKPYPVYSKEKIDRSFVNLLGDFVFVSYNLLNLADTRLYYRLIKKMDPEFFKNNKEIHKIYYRSFLGRPLIRMMRKK